MWGIAWSVLTMLRSVLRARRAEEGIILQPLPRAVARRVGDRWRRGRSRGENRA